MDLLRRLVSETPRLLTLEEHLEIGGFGAGVLEAFHDAGLPTEGVKVHAIADQFIDHSPQAQQRHNLKLDVEGVVEKVLSTFPDLGRSSKGAPGEGRPQKKFAETVTW
jgi:1-deoxy-D-xylulose-5-phosphate synthase